MVDGFGFDFWWCECRRSINYSTHQIQAFGFPENEESNYRDRGMCQLSVLTRTVTPIPLSNLYIWNFYLPIMSLYKLQTP